MNISELIGQAAWIYEQMPFSSIATLDESERIWNPAVDSDRQQTLCLRVERQSCSCYFFLF
jgi:hypothetical protein